jgi:hypothetical protein
MFAKPTATRRARTWSAALEWISSPRPSLMGLAAQDRQDLTPSPAQEAGMEAVRQAMLDLMAQAGPTDQHLELLIMINYAGAIQTLWYARSEIMQALAASCGEAYAQQQLETLSAQFIGLLPEARHYRPGRRLR